MTETAQLGYVTGVSDTAQFVIGYVSEPEASYEEDMRRIQRMTNCLDIRGRRLGALRYYAMDVWEKTKFQEAGAETVLMLDACDTTAP